MSIFFCLRINNTYKIFGYSFPKFCHLAVALCVFPCVDLAGNAASNIPFTVKKVIHSVSDTLSNSFNFHADIISHFCKKVKKKKNKT